MGEVVQAAALVALTIGFSASLKFKAELWALVPGVTLLMGSCSVLEI